MVSIIIPAYNAEKFIINAIESALNQSFSDIEVIVINDGSTDSTAQIVEELSQNDKRIRLISTDNGGVSRARNTGLDNANGDFVCFLDADDLLLPNSIELMMELMVTNDVDIVSGCHSHSASNEALEGKILTGEEALIKHIEDHPIGYSSCAKLYRTNAIRDIRFVEGRKINEDSFFVFECFSKVKSVICTGQKVYQVILSENSASRANQFSEKYFDILFFAKEKINLIERDFPHLSEKTKGILIKANMALLSVMSKYKLEKKYKKIEKQLIKEVIRNKKSFVPSIEWDKKWFFIITHYMYGFYKFFKRRKTPR